MNAVAAISQSALANNLMVVRSYAPNSKIISMVKSNAYGHHLDLVMPLMEADILAVSELNEVRPLRKLTNKPILLLPGIFNDTDLQEAIQLNCHLVFHDLSQLTVIKNSKDSINLWIKVDTGMHRLGLPIDQLEQTLSQLKNHSNIHIECVMTHFACADEPTHIKNYQQFDTFSKLNIQHYSRSMANSAAIMSLDKSHFDYVRPGIMLYGASPFSNINEQLTPAMKLSAPILSLKIIKAGESIGYGAIWTAKKDSRIVTIGIGYGDGYPRHAKTGTPVMINNTLCKLAGRVSMDLICVDIGDLEVNVGDIAILWGDSKLRVETVASYSDTISYELLTGVSSRVSFIQSA